MSSHIVAEKSRDAVAQGLSREVKKMVANERGQLEWRNRRCDVLWRPRVTVVDK